MGSEGETKGVLNVEQIIDITCSVSFCVFIGVSVLALLVSVFSSRKAYGAFFLGMLAALIVWSVSKMPGV